MIDYANYLLPAGTDLVTGRLVGKQESTNALRDLKVQSRTLNMVHLVHCAI